MALAGLSAAHVLLHLLVYAAGLRNRPALKEERGIFLWHAVSFCLCVTVVAAAGLLWRPSDWFAGAVFAAALHGVYSLSFLEVWSLTQISYSLAILAEVARLGRASRADLVRFERVGSTKQEIRVESLQRLRLLGPEGRPTPPGRIAGGFLRLILWLSNGRMVN